MAMSSTPSPSATPSFDREVTPSASATLPDRPRTTIDARSATELARIRRHASPISVRSSVRIADAIEDSARPAATRAGATASTAATPATANVAGWERKPAITTAAPIATAADPAWAMTRRGSLPRKLSSGATTAATPHSARHACRVCGLDARKIGITRYNTTIATTDQAACTITQAAGGAEREVCVIQELKGHSARRPAIPMNKRTDPTTSERTVHPGLVCRIGSRVLRFCVP